MTRTTPDLAPPSPSLRTTSARGRLAATYDFSLPYHFTTRPPRSYVTLGRSPPRTFGKFSRRIVFAVGMDEEIIYHNTTLRAEAETLYPMSRFCSWVFKFRQVPAVYAYRIIMRKYD
ncbi:hypothetical protein AVEN_152137-1 [Araneus ventricosus]|uniref:Uncharacterized protein n=1 Tax=Araneus ventricosus TaxID=182803 RepID=A0A4Y2V9H5_ARAVE|nr:hypothetical protein AVEN_45361-1 [Araneus ventricosus]GBO20380.1 hypothetical protein AVEN_152137-1 [Araneus ventricosus]